MYLPCTSARIWFHPSPSPPVTTRTPHYVSACLGHSLGHNLDISHLNNAVVICQTPLSVSSRCVPRRSGVMLRCDRCLSGTMHLSARAYTHALCVGLIETDALCIWAFRESECVWQTVNQPVMRGNRTVDRSISYFLRRQTEEKHHCSPRKWFPFHRSFISLFSSYPPFLPSVCLPLSRSTLNLAVGLFISAHFSSCLSHREGGGDPADQGWVMVYEHSLWAMRAPLGWIIYTGPRREQTYVSQSHQRHSKAGLSTSTHLHRGKQNTLGHAMYQVQALTSWRAKLTISLFYCQTSRGKASNMWPNMGEKSSASKLHFLVIPSCFPAAHSASVSSHQQLELVDLGLLCM